MKNIILLSDGTGNGAAKNNKTNVWRLYVALDMHNRNQIAMYDDGVGSQHNTVLKALGGVFGFGLKRNVIEMYKYLCRNYKDGSKDTSTEKLNIADKIYLFGFSRGAFTVRILADFIISAGLYTEYTSEEDLHKVSRQNYYVYRQKYKMGYLNRFVKFLIGKKHSYKNNIKPDIEFIGVWDTVDAYGFPFDELTTLWDRLIYPLRFPDQDLSPKVKRACHALSVDDERQTFHPVLWNENVENSNRIEQVWFPGVHSDVGGGYPRNSLALVTLDWMLSRVEAESTEKGLVFIDGIRQTYQHQSDWNAPQHDSRSALSAYYRYKPRHIYQLCHDKHAGVTIDKPKIHRSVFERIKGQGLPYSPAFIPADYAVAATDQQRSIPQYESVEQAHKRTAALNFAQDVIFWRRRLYIALLLVTLLFVTSRFFLDWDKSGICAGSACFIDPVLQAAINFVPDLAAGWIEALRQHPGWLVGLLASLSLLLYTRRFAYKKTQEYSRKAWSKILGLGDPPEWSGSFTQKLRHLGETRFKRIAVWLGAVVVFFILLYLFFAVINAVVFHFRYTTGALCKESGTATMLSSPTTLSFDVINACYATGIKLEKGKTYQFKVQDTPLKDGNDITTDPDGYSQARLIPFVPLRRHITQNWMKLYGKIGADGFENFPMGKGVTDYIARSDGELFLYVNDAVFGFFWDAPYQWKSGKNSGNAVLTVSEVQP